MESITEEMKIHEIWYKETKNYDLETLPEFLNHLMNDYNHDYGTICHALAAGAIATCWAMNKKAGITGFQAGAIMWQFIKEWMRYDSPLKLINYENMLYPQYESYYRQEISKDTFDWLQKEAKKALEENPDATERVKKHWESIVNGKVPFGYKLEFDRDNISSGS